MKRYGLIGRTLTHSFSKAYFTEKFREAQHVGCVYDNFELSGIAAFPALLQRYPDIKGLNVTIPYKEAILPFLTETDPVVKAVGACNCIRVSGKRIVGYNTDTTGFRNVLEPLLQPQHQRALVLGTGGASKAVCYVLRALRIDVTTVSRIGGAASITYEAVDEGVLSTHHLIVNTTPLGTSPNTHESPRLPYQLLTPRHLLFDLVYNPPETMFLAQGKARGAQTVNGYGMLVQQAEAAWEIWNENV